MIVFTNFKALDNITAPAESEVKANTEGEILTVEVIGSASSLILNVMGVVDFKNEEYISLAGIDLNSMSLVTSVSKPGIYQFPLDGIGRYKIAVPALSGGNLTVFCRVSKGV